MSTKLPFPRRVSMTPASLRVRSASRTVMRLTPVISMSSFSLGSMSPLLVHPLVDHGLDLLDHLLVELSPRDNLKHTILFSPPSPPGTAGVLAVSWYDYLLLYHHRRKK